MIREYQEKDAEPLTRLWLESTCDAHPFIPLEYWKSHMDEIQKEYLPHAHTTVWEEEGELLGFISVVEENWIGRTVFIAQGPRQGHRERTVGTGKKRGNLCRWQFIVKMKKLFPSTKTFF